MSYSVAIRSYKRPELIKKRTLTALLKCGVSLKDKVEVFVANEEEKEIYSQSLVGEFEVKAIRVAVLGSGASANYVFNLYDGSQQILWDFDDDLTFTGIYHPPWDQKIKQPVVGDMLEVYSSFAYKAMKEYGVSGVSLSGSANMLHKKDKPWAEIRPANMFGQNYGVIPDASKHSIPLWVTHNTDCTRSAQTLDKDGGILIFNGFVMGDASNYGVHQGGMQASGDRGDKESATERTRLLTERAWAEIPQLRDWYKEPTLVKTSGLWSFKVKAINQLKTSLPHKVKHVTWQEPFGEPMVKAFPKV